MQTVMTEQMLHCAIIRDTDNVILEIDTHGADINGLTADRIPRIALMIAIENNDQILFDALLGAVDICPVEARRPAA